MRPARIAALALAAMLCAPAAAQAEPEAAAWQLTGTALPTNFAPGSANDEILLTATNLGAKASAGPILFTDTLPPGFTPTSVQGGGCEISGQVVHCESSEAVQPGRELDFKIILSAAAGPGEGQSEASIEGGAAAPAATSTPLRIDPAPAPFGFLPGPSGFGAPFTRADGSPATAAASHPYQLTVSLGFPTEKVGVSLGAAGHLRDVSADLPAGTIVDPAATPVLCTEAELNLDLCPDASQIGTATAITVVSRTQTSTSPLYNMVPPPGAPAEFGFDAVGVGIFIHVLGSLRSDGDYGLSGASQSLPGLNFHPIFGTRLDLWGRPSAKSHDGVRGECLALISTCEIAVERQQIAFLTLPARCSGEPTTTLAHADSWEQPGLFSEASYQSADLAGDSVSIDACNGPQFEPTISSQPTTNLADSPSGLDFDLHQPTDSDFEHTATAPLRDATVTLPAGMVVNPSQADGLGACTESEIGYHPETGHFDKLPASCPDAAKLGTLQVKTPLLAQTDEAGTHVLRDPETGAVLPRTLQGSVYLAKPFDNPSASLIAIYLSIEDPQSGTVAKLAGRVIADPETGRLTTRFEENPQLPLEDVRLHLFGGARGALITPPSCGTHTTTTTLTPWSSPEGADATPSDSFQTTAAPGGGNCPTSAGAEPLAPGYQAGTLSPAAGQFSPLVLRFSRSDGEQRITSLQGNVPAGLLAKLAGVSECPDAVIASIPTAEGTGQAELDHPSCPAGSLIGHTDVGAGAGPTPFYVHGSIYLAGPYRGAPLSLAFVTPAVAGPFDLGNVVIRDPLTVDPETAQIHDHAQIPTILHGIPLDIRDVRAVFDRPSFTLNPTSCDPMSFASTIGGAGESLTDPADDVSVSASNPFQVGGCQALGFKPNLSLRLEGGTKRGAHPALRAVLTMPKPGVRHGSCRHRGKRRRCRIVIPPQANIAKAVVSLPHSEFLDQGHIGTVCTRVQFAEGSVPGEKCPPASIYGHARAITPLLDQPLEGPVFLRSSSHNLPDLVAALNGQIQVALDGRVDSIHGGIRNSFEVVPDAPVSKFVLTMQGGAKGLLQNSTDLCASTNRATALFDGQNGKVSDTEPVLRAKCPKDHKKKGKGHRRHHHPRAG